MNIWDDIYREDRWGGGSGPGSKEETTREYRAFVEKFIRERGISHVLDVGCGDGVLANLINWWPAKYHGIDASDEAIRKAESNSCPDRVHLLKVADSGEGHPIPVGDRFYSLALVKDVFQHLPFAKISEVMRSLKGFKHILVTNDVPEDGAQPDCREGDWRPVDITLPPLGFKAREVLRWKSVPMTKKAVHIVNF